MRGVITGQWDNIDVLLGTAFVEILLVTDEMGLPTGFDGLDLECDVRFRFVLEEYGVP